MDNNLRSAIEKTKALMPKAEFAVELAVKKALENREEIADWCNTLNSSRIDFLKKQQRKNELKN